MRESSCHSKNIQISHGGFEIDLIPGYFWCHRRPFVHNQSLKVAVPYGSTRQLLSGSSDFIISTWESFKISLQKYLFFWTVWKSNHNCMRKDFSSGWRMVLSSTCIKKCFSNTNCYQEAKDSMKAHSFTYVLLIRKGLEKMLFAINYSFWGEKNIEGVFLTSTI